MAHKHAAQMMQFAQDAAETDKPWERWETRWGTDEWEKVGGAPTWNENFEYRRIAERRSFGGLEWLAPMTEAPEEGERYWVVDATLNDPISNYLWQGDSQDSRLFDRGLAFATEEAARDAWAAMQKFLGGAA